MTTPHEAVANAIEDMPGVCRDPEASYLESVNIYDDADLIAATAIEVLRDGAKERLQELRDSHKCCNDQCSIGELWEEDQSEIIEAILGPKAES